MTPATTENIGAENRIPYKLMHSEGGLQCQWIKTGNKRFDEPFFDDTIASLRILNYKDTNPPHVSSAEDMQRLGQQINGLSPSVIVFHISRCGSTLVSQLFASSGRFIVLSEAPFFDEILRLPLSARGFDETEMAGLLSSALNIYGRKRDALEEHVVLKTDCWHIFFHHTLRKMFPAVPFVLMYRSPGEVFASLNKMPGWQTIPQLVDPRIFGLPGMPEQYNREIYTATIIEKMLAKFLDVAETDSSCMLVNYNEGALAAVKKVAAFANIALSGEETGIMEQRSRYHSKKPGELWTKDPAAEVPECLRPAMRLYDALEEQRKMA